MKAKKKKKRKGKGKKRKGKHQSKYSPSSPVLSIDDMPSLPPVQRTKFNLYKRWEGIPRDDSFFQRWLVTTPPDDPGFSRLGGDTAIRLLLSDTAPAVDLRGNGSSSTDKKANTNVELPSIEESSSLKDLFKNDYIDDSPLPVSWLQRQTLQPGSGSRRGMYRHQQGTSDNFMCSECEISRATSLCRTCNQLFCLECVQYLHRARVGGLLGHTIIENIKDIIPQEQRPGCADINDLMVYRY